ncbi:MAG: class IV adenylate cyclase [Candidatus Doudnabacteria bacterium]|nr:class IV adenylate cyclase [Candidatus Doudnabacteria bacterium]
MKEIEIKVQLENFDAVKAVLEQQGCVFSPVKEQKDTIFIPNQEPTVPVPAGVNVLRIRRQKNKIVFTLKQSDFGNNLSKTEIETEILDGESMENAIAHLDYKKVAIINKTRQTCEFKGFEICLDRVEGLGDYLEMEKITDEDPKVIQAEMMSQLESLGVDTSKRIDYGYDVLYVKKYGK